MLLGLVLGSVQPMVMSMLHQITPEARHGQALGLRMMAINASSVMMPMMFGSLGAVLGVSALFWGGGGHGWGSHHACPGCWGVIRLQTGSAQSFELVEVFKNFARLLRGCRRIGTVLNLQG